MELEVEETEAKEVIGAVMKLYCDVSCTFLKLLSSETTVPSRGGWEGRE